MTELEKKLEILKAQRTAATPRIQELLSSGVSINDPELATLIQIFVDAKDIQQQVEAIRSDKNSAIFAYLLTYFRDKLNFDHHNADFYAKKRMMELRKDQLSYLEIMNRGWSHADIEQYDNILSLSPDFDIAKVERYEAERMAIDPDFKTRIVMARLTDGELS